MKKRNNIKRTPEQREADLLALSMASNEINCSNRNSKTGYAVG